MNESLVQIPLAIVGIACRLPGCDGIDEFWSMLSEGRDGIVPFPENRLDRELYFDPDKGVRGKTYTQLGGMIPSRPPNPELMPWNDAKKSDWDECHLIFGEVAAAACRNAKLGTDYFRNSPVGIFIGHSGGSRISGDIAYALLADQTADLLNDIPAFQSLDAARKSSVIDDLVSRMREGRPIRRPGNTPFCEASSIARLVAELLDIHGPQLVLDAACASSLVALGLAALELQSGKIDAAIVGGASYNKSDSLILFSQAQSCSATGTRPFDDAADGLISAEGYVALVIKTLDRAVVDKDNIWGVIRGLGIASDGKGKSLWAPRREGQLTAIQRAYFDEVRPEHVQFLEAHATSTQVGDATEMQALADYFSKQDRTEKLPIGSVKSNLGHTLETAGMAGLLKTLLAMHHGAIPGTVHLDTPNKAIPWDSLPFTVPRQTTPWNTPQDRPRCAAVNAFGIGGLNVHVVLEQFQPEYHRNLLNRDLPSDQPRASEKTKWVGDCRDPIAIIGRGVIVPGATGCQAFTKLKTEAKDFICDAPALRWRKGIGIDAQGNGAWTVPSARGGYLLDYAYDWRRHRIPPKQVDRANPLQFMLLDAAGQAIEEANSGLSKLPNQRTAVVVGNVFGGEFGTQLILGLRLEELKRDLRNAFAKAHIKDEVFSQICDAFEERFFEVNPALLDETGSFTSSTLASRITKQYNFMGGALAIDSGDMSALAALSSSCSLLQRGSVDAVVCAAGQRAMDLPAYKSFQMEGWLDPNTNPPHLPGEGVIVFLLKRLSDAQRDNDTIFGVIDDIQSEFQSYKPDVALDRLLAQWNPELANCISHAVTGSATNNHLLNEVAKRLPNATVSSSPLIGKIGDLKPIHSFVSLLDRLTPTPQREGRKAGRELLSSTCRLGHAYTLLFRGPNALDMQALPMQNAPRKVSQADSSESSLNGKSKVIRNPSPITMSKDTLKKSPISVTWLAAQSWAELAESARRWAQDLGLKSFAASRGSSNVFDVAIVARGEAELRERLAALAEAQPEAVDRLQRQGIFVCLPQCRGVRSLVAAFPGQGSQYAHMLAGWLQFSEQARETLAHANAILQELNSPRYEELAEAAGKGGPSTWPTQASMLISEAVLGSALGFRDFTWAATTGHSLGELAAMLATDAWELRSALTFLRSRAAGVDKVEPRGSLLSIAADEDSVRNIMAAYPAPISITHVNSPKQVVLGGPSDDIQRFAVELSRRNVGNTVLAVPAAFHTALMARAQIDLAPAARDAKVLPPRFPLLSSVSNRYVSDPNEIKRNLIDQLTTPVRYYDVIEKLYADGARVFVEFGPGQVLTNLHRVILHGRPCVLWSVDRADGDCERAAVELQVLGDLFGCNISRSVPNTLARTNAIQSSASFAGGDRIAIFDATEARRKKSRQRASQQTLGSNDEIRQSWPASPTTPPSQPTRSTAVDSQDSQDFRFQTENESSQPIHSAASSIDSTADTFELEKFLRDFIVEHTGYPPDMIEMDWDLEADLGIDSIKQAQLFGELREIFEFDVKQLASGNVRTLRQMIELLSQSGEKKSDWNAQGINAQGINAQGINAQGINAQGINAQGIPESLPNAVIESWEADRSEECMDRSLDFFVPSETADEYDSEDNSTRDFDVNVSESIPANADAANQSWKSVPRDELSRFMIDFVVEHTGYPPDIVELDADFEADLGLDSIKLAQLFGELRNHFNLAIDLSNREVLANCRTLNEILNLFALNGSETDLRPQGDCPDREVIAEGFSEVGNGEKNFSAEEYESAFAWARDHSQLIWNRLAEYADSESIGASTGVEASTLLCELPPAERSRIRGIADGAGFDVENIAGVLVNSELFPEYRQLVVDPGTLVLDPDEDNRSLSPIAVSESEVCRRFALRLQRTETFPNASMQPIWTGAAAIVGNNAIADAIVAQLNRDGVKCLRLGGGLTNEQLVAEFDTFWKQHPIHHMFLTSPHDTAARTQFDPTWWQLRQSSGVRSAFWICQRWMQRLTEANSVGDATLVGFANLGGQFGLNGHVVSAEGGGIAGLLKAIMIESWVNGFRSMPIKVLDTVESSSPGQAVRAAWYELANPSYDTEIAWRGSERSVIRAVPTPNKSEIQQRFTRKGNWILTGGGRGITAHVAKTIAKRYGVSVHLIGRSAIPNIPDAWRDLDAAGTRRLKLDIMEAARKGGKKPIQEWQDTEKLLEVDATLRQFHDEGMRAYYYSCDVANYASLSRVVDQIRATHGPITGCIHGAGAGQDARFDRKRPDKVEQCFGSKIEGALGLMHATRNDPLECFVGFGSISGRFGANGHTDYSSANDMLAKIVDWYRTVRPEVPAATFHWHAWDDVGMAAKAETRLALEMIDMHFMPAREGVDHLLRELESGLPEREVLVTDDRYYRLFSPAETTARGLGESQSSKRRSLFTEPPKPIDDLTTNDRCVLDPLKEVFLREHCLQNRPLLPIVVGLELLAESALGRIELDGWIAKKRSIQITDLRAIRGLRFFDDRALTVDVTSRLIGERKCASTLHSDFYARNGRLVEASRPYLQAIFSPGPINSTLGWPAMDADTFAWENVKYPSRNDQFFVGDSFQVLKKAYVENNRVFGRIIAPALVHLAGANRDVATWHIPCAVLDACLFTTGILAWKSVRPGISLPVGIQHLVIWSQPAPGQMVTVESRLKRSDEKNAWFDFCLRDQTSQIILEAVDYQIAWID